MKIHPFICTNLLLENIFIFIFFILFTFHFSQGYSQIYTMTNGGSASTCGGTFYDPGGTGNYSGGSGTMVYTICSSTPGKVLQIDFTSFSLWSNGCIWGASVDHLNIYDGSSTASPQIASFSNSDGLGQTLYGSSGCLTFEFVREDEGGFGCDDNDGDIGWSASLSCIDEVPQTGETCAEAAPFCSDQSYSFPNSTSTTAPSGPNYGCLGTEPNPVWYYMQVAQDGDIDIHIQQSSTQGGSPDLDVDFALWGPFTSVADGCGQIMPGDAAPIDCSYSTAATEDANITGAVAGEFYIILITNYSESSGFIQFSQTNYGSTGAGETDCSIVTPCNLDNFTATVSACNAGTYDVTGSIEFTNAPSTGDLIVEDCDGNQTVVASAPFTSPVSYSITGLNANGSACSVQTYFTEDNTCTQTINYTAPSCSCNFNSMNLTVGTCNGFNQFDITGTVEFTDPPSTGQLVIEDCNGNSVSYNAPFTSPQNFTISGITADGATCHVTATFTADPTCTITSNDYTNPAGCNCDAQIGTFTVTTDGTSLGGDSYVLCYGDQITITANGDFVPPAQVANEPAGTTYDPAIGYLVYSCPPTIATTPSNTPPNDDINNDPCFLGIAGFSSGTGGIFDIDDGAGLGSLAGLTDRTVYIVPITFYDQTNGYYSVINGGLPCYQMGSPIKVQYLTEIDTVKTQDCQAGTVSVQISGGSAEVNGTNFTASNLTPTTATISTNNVANGGTIVVSGLQDGDSYAFDILDEYGCGVHVTGTFQGVEPSDFTYPDNAYCQNGSTNPSPTITGTSGGTFTASPTGLSINSATGAIDLAASTPGNYTVTYTSPGAPCNSSTDFTITINDIPTITVADQTICNGEIATLTASGADTYSWSPATGLSATTGATVQSTVTTSTTYTITGTNSTTGCSGSTSATVTVNPLPTIDAGADVAICSGDATTLTATGGSTYTWDNSLGAGASHSVSPTATTTYEVTGTDANGCVNTDQVVVTVNPLPTIDAGADVAICSGDATTLTATGGSTYTWDNGLGAGASHSVSPTATTTYEVTGTDANGCVNTDQVVVTVNPLPTYTAAITDATCGSSNGEISLTAASGTAPYNYSIDNGTNTQINSVFTGLAAGNYSILISDNNGCQVTGSETVVEQNAPVIDNITPTDPSCYNVCDGEIQATITGGTAPFTYEWTDASNNSTVGGNNATASNLCDGTYNLTVTDANNCSVTHNNITLTQPSQIVATFDVTDHCQGSSNQATNIATSGGSFSFNPAPSDGATINASTGSISNGVGGTTYTIEYNVTMNGCSASSTQDVTVYELPSYTSTITDATCGNANGEIDLTTNTGNAPFTYSIDNGTSTQSTGLFTGLTSGNYSILISDNNGCEVTGTESVAQLNQPSIGSITSMNPSCYGLCDGSASVTVVGGATPYSYAWTDVNNANVGATDEATNLCDGQYAITITDANGCSVSGTATLVEPAQIDPSFTLTDYCEGEANSASNIATPGGVFSFSPDPGDGATINASSGGIVNGVGGTTYTVQYEAIVGGCSETTTQDVTVNPLPVPNFIADTLSGCIPLTVTFTQISPFSNNPNGGSTSCLWEFGDGDSSDVCDVVTHTYNKSGTYTVGLSQTTSAGCHASYQISNYIEVSPQPVAEFSASTTTVSTTEPVVNFTNSSSHASNYTWNFGDESPLNHDENPSHEFSTEDNTNYVITLIASNDNLTCSDTASLALSVKEQVIFYVPNTFTPDKDNFNETFKPIFASGYDPYSYTLLIFNRWGEILFESHNVNVGWNGTYGGKIVADGTYIWKITFKEAKGMSDKHHTKVGHVNLLR